MARTRSTSAPAPSHKPRKRARPNSSPPTSRRKSTAQDVPVADQTPALRNPRHHPKEIAVESRPELRETRPLNCSHQVCELGVKGWTMDQEVALQSAYFLVRPSPNFWFEISKKVPGKTAKECFDKFYSANPTPPVPQSRVRKPVAGSPIRPISFPSPISAIKAKHHFGTGKHKLLKAHQTVRHILRKQRIADGSYEADVFAAVEPVCPNLVTPPLPAFELSTYAESSVTTPDHSSNTCSSGIRRRDAVWGSTLLNEKHQICHSDKSQGSTEANISSELLSPEVLKKESNPQRLDRYLDKLHLRRANKQKKSAHKAVGQGQFSTEEGLVMRPRSEKSSIWNISAARDAIITGAKEMLKTVLHRQASVEDVASELFDEDAEGEASFVSDV